MKKIIAILIIAGAVAILGIMSALPKKEVDAGQKNNTAVPADPRRDTSNMSVAMAPAEKVEVFLFHRTQRCATCIAIGELSGQTVKESFAQEAAAGKIEFREINIDNPENKSLAEKFKASGSSLFINAVRNGADNIQEDTQVWRLTNDAQAFKDHLAGKINALLGK